MKVIDLSKPVRFNREDPFFMRVKVKHKPHRLAKLLCGCSGCRSVSSRGISSDGPTTRSAWARHATTHIDAPWHYGPVSAGAPAQTIDEIPLDRCIGAGVVLDLSHKADDDPITVADMEAALAKTGATLTEQTIVLIRTGRDKLMDTKEFWQTGTGMSAAATEWLLDRGVTVMGIDQWGWDLPFRAQIAKSQRHGRCDAVLGGASRGAAAALLAHGAVDEPRRAAGAWIRGGGISPEDRRRLGGARKGGGASALSGSARNALYLHGYAGALRRERRDLSAGIFGAGAWGGNFSL